MTAATEAAVAVAIRRSPCAPSWMETYPCQWVCAAWSYAGAPAELITAVFVADDTCNHRFCSSVPVEVLKRSEPTTTASAKSAAGQLCQSSSASSPLVQYPGLELLQLLHLHLLLCQRCLLGCLQLCQLSSLSLLHTHHMDKQASV